MLGEDGQKMSKSKRNYREPREIFDKFGADALRWYFFANQPPWTSIRYAERAIKDSIPAHADFMGATVQKAIMPQALELVHRHQAAGDIVAIVTATNEFVTRPIAHAFGVDALIAVELERETSADGNGWFTGAIRGVPSFREGKVVRVEAWLKERGLTWDTVHTTFYSDSMNDLPLLEKATVPVATNPDERLRALAVARGWRILDLFS